MLLSYLIGLPVLGAVFVMGVNTYEQKSVTLAKITALSVSVLNLLISLFVFILFHNSTNYFQYVEEHYNVQYFDLYLGVDGISIYFVLLTTIIMPIALLSN
jgi:NADH:ubiquinone oxidoreductase subunit 4 (subunit M)